jgi:hypothetical protein
MLNREQLLENLRLAHHSNFSGNVAYWQNKLDELDKLDQVTSSGPWVVRDTLTGATYVQPNKTIALLVAEAHGHSEVYQRPNHDPRIKYPEVALFVDLMYRELMVNAHKGDQAGWRKMSLREAWAEISWHVGKLTHAIRTEDKALMEEHAADIANGAMMFVDILNQENK